MNDTPDFPHTQRGVSRRTFLAAGAAVAAAMLPSGLSRVITTNAAQPGAPTAATRTLSVVRAEAIATTGTRLINSPWLTYFNGQVTGWSAMYVSWLLRGNGLPKTTDVQQLYNALKSTGRIGPLPQPGSLIFYGLGDPGAPYHVGFVDTVTAQLPQSIEGDAASNTATEERFVRRFGCPWDRRVNFGYPSYA